MVGLRQRYEKNPGGFFAVLLFFIPLVVYSCNLSFGFVLDDNIQVLNNPWIRDAGYIPKILFSTAWAYADEHGAANSYRPVMHFVYMAEYHVFGLNPRWFHLVNIVLHSLNAVLVFLIASFLFAKYSDRKSPENKKASRYYLPFIAGLLFALHPINTGVVSWVAAVPELTYTLFFLLAFYQYARAQKGSAGLSMPRYLSSCLFFFIALMSKEPAIVLPIFIILYDFTLRGRGVLRLWKRYAPYLAILMAYIFLRLYAMGGLMHHKEVAFSPYESFINIFPLVARYTEKLFLPINLNIIYPLHPVSSILEPLSIAGMVIVIIFLLATFLLYRSRVLFISLFWIALPLGPALYIPALPVGGFANRYLYLSTGGFALLVCLLIWRLLTLSGGLRKAAIALILIILPLYTAGAVLRSMVWRDDYTLWTDMLKKAPEFERAHFSYAWILQQRGDVDEAIYHYKEALKSRPDNVKAHYNIAVLYYGKGQIDRAMLHYKAAIRLDPKNTAPYYNLAIIYQQRGDNIKAILLYRAILNINPQHENAHFNVARAYEDEGEAEKAVSHYREVIRLRPQSADAFYRLGVIYASHGRSDEAARSFSAALRADPKYEAARAARETLRESVNKSKSSGAAR